MKKQKPSYIKAIKNNDKYNDKHLRRKI